MTGEGGVDFTVHPDAVPDLDRTPIENPTPVVGVGALCDVWSGTPTSRRQSFSVLEFVDLEDGRRVMLDQRGWTQARVGGSDDDPSATTTEDDLIESVLNVTLPDNDDNPDDHDWVWLAKLAQARGLDVTEADLRRLQYEVVLAPGLLHWLHDNSPSS